MVAIAPGAIRPGSARRLRMMCACVSMIETAATVAVAGMDPSPYTGQTRGKSSEETVRNRVPIVDFIESLAGLQEHGLRHGDAERVCRLHVDEQLKGSWMFEGQV